MFYNSVTCGFSLGLFAVHSKVRSLVWVMIVSRLVLAAPVVRVLVGSLDGGLRDSPSTLSRRKVVRNDTGDTHEKRTHSE